MKYSFVLMLIFSLTFFYLKPQSYQNNANNKTKMVELASGYILSRAIYVAAQLKVADFLVNRSSNISDLALKTDTNQDALQRLMRFLASYDIFHEDLDHNFSLTPLSEQFISTDENSLWAWITYHHEPNRWIAYGDMEQSIKTGSPAFNTIFGKGYFDFIAESPILSKGFDEGMKNISADENADITRSYDFSPYATIVDIGGGTGGLLAEIITNNPCTQALLFDLPHVQSSAQKDISFIPSQGFFDPIPKNADLYILKRILHDWNDQECVTILQHCYNAMPDNARLLIIEAIVAPENTRDFAKDVDIEMMVLFGGKERTKKEWSILLEKAQFNITNVFSTSSLLSIIEVQKK
jgi:hypothetical protein